jgi:hypothetical protein
MLDNPALILVLCLVLIVGLGFPISLLLAARRGEEVQEISLYKKATKRARNIWGAEDQQLDELSKRVEELKDKPD